MDHSSPPLIAADVDVSDSAAGPSAHRLATDEDGAEIDGEGRAVRKRRRRIISCENCRKQKCRCEIEAGYSACARCRLLRYFLASRRSHEKIVYRQPITASPVLKLAATAIHLICQQETSLKRFYEGGYSSEMMVVNIN